MPVPMNFSIPSPLVAAALNLVKDSPTPAAVMTSLRSMSSALCGAARLQAGRDGDPSGFPTVTEVEFFGTSPGKKGLFHGDLMVI